jgi:hypothetical protein
MSDSERDITISETPTGWLAVSHEYPRLGEVGATRDEAVARLHEARDSWRQLHKEPAPV